MTSAGIPETFGAWVRTRRRQLDLTQAELGRRAGCSEAAIRKIEADERSPSRQLAELMAKVLEIPASDHQLFLRFARGALIEELPLKLETKSSSNNLPTLLTSTIDRARDLTHLIRILKEEGNHLMTILGPPGIGKTRLSIRCGMELLNDFPDGVWFVDLAEIDNPGFFIPAIARSLENLDLPPAPDLSQLLSGLKNKTLLLILDNFEHIVEREALDVAQILKSCRHLKILVTSRVPLHIYGENEYLLPPLSVPPREGQMTPDELMQYESVQLLVARIRQHQLNFSISPGNASKIVEICHILDGIPLAIELAAASLRRMALDEMVVLLRGKNWVKDISTPARDLPHRQRTLENVIDWSSSLLDEEQRDFFYRLGIFSGWFDAKAAGTVCQKSLSRSLELLNILTDHSLLMREAIEGTHHWRMLELIHEYSETRISQRNHVELLRAEYYLGKIQELRRNAPRSEQEDYFQLNFGNLHSAVRWAIQERQNELSLQGISVLYEFWHSLGYLKEGLDVMNQFLTLRSDIDAHIRVRYLQDASTLAWQQHDFTTALNYAEEAIQLDRAYGMESDYPEHLNLLGRVYIEQGKFSEARSVLQECLALVNENSTVFDPGVPLAQLGEVSLFQGRLDEAESLLKSALPRIVHDDEIFIPMVETDLAEIALARKDYPTAKEWLEQACEIASRHIRRLLVFLCALAGYLVLTSRNSADIRRAAQLYGAIESLGMRSGANFNPFYQKLNQERITLARQKLSKQEWLTAFETGRGWGRSEVIRQAKKELGM